MKWLLAIVVVGGFALGQVRPAPPPAGSGTGQSAPAALLSQDEGTRKAKALLDQAIQALGGQAYLNVQDMRQQGRTYSFHHGQPTGAGGLYWLFRKYPDKERVELTKQRDWIIIHNGDRGYEITYKGTAAEDPEELEAYLRRRQVSLEWVLRRWLNQPGVALFYDGPAVAEQKPADQVTLMNAQNQSVTLLLDTSTHLPIKKTYSWRDPKDRQLDTESEIYDNYRVVQGINTPHSVSRVYNGDMANQRFIGSVAYNQNLPDSLFTAQVSYDPKALPKKH